MSDKRLRIYYRVGVAEPVSTTWQVWAHRTSFYLTNASLGGLKVSLHGMDERHPGAEHFRVEPDPRSGKAIASADDIMLFEPRTGWPLKFAGTSHERGVHAIRIRTTHEASIGPGKAELPSRGGSATARMPPPAPGWATDLDLVFEQPGSLTLKAQTFNAQLNVSRGSSLAQIALRTGRPDDESGFVLDNDFGIRLRCRTSNRRLDLFPTPAEVAIREAEGVRRCVSIDVDENGVLWIVEDMTRAQVR